MGSKTYKIAVLPGDGIGVDVIAEGRKVLERVGEVFGVDFEFTEALIGWAAIDGAGTALPEETVRICRESDAIYFGAVGDPARDNTLPPRERPEPVALLGLRKGLYANLRPAILKPALLDVCPLRPEIVKDGVDILIIRELTGGLYYGRPKGPTEVDGIRGAVDTMVYTTPEVERIARVGFEAARKRKKKLCSVDKANVLACGQLWREVVTNLAKEYPDVELSHLYVDNAAMQLIRNPSAFDVIVTENTFGDILSDEASMLAGSMGMLPSACLGDADSGITPFYEPIHGSAPDIAGKGIANPIAAILTAAMMLRHSFGLHDAAAAIERAVDETINAGYRTSDIVVPGGSPISTSEMGAQITQRIIQA